MAAKLTVLVAIHMTKLILGLSQMENGSVELVIGFTTITSSLGGDKVAIDRWFPLYMVIGAAAVVGALLTIQHHRDKAHFMDNGPALVTSLPAPIPPAAPEPAPELAWVTKLREEAKARKVNWRIYCHQEWFYGVAWAYGTDEMGSWNYEEGGKGKWIVKGASQREAASLLGQAITRMSGSDWFPAKPLPKPEPERAPEHICPPELSGGEQEP